MCPIQIKSGSFNNNKTSNQDRGFGDGYQDFVRARAVNLLEVINKYGININKYDNKIICPFPFHKENSPSFNYYDDSNSFYCYGCKSGGGSIEFVSFMENNSKYEAAQSLLNNFKVDNDLIVENNLSGQRRKIILEFSDLIRNFLLENNNSKNSLEYAEKITLVFDNLCEKNKIEEDGIIKMISILKQKLEQYKEY